MNTGLDQYMDIFKDAVEGRVSGGNFTLTSHGSVRSEGEIPSTYSTSY